jgi:hypothetical protein
MPFLLAEILNFQGSTHLIGVGSLSNIISISDFFDRQMNDCIHITKEILRA